MKTRTHLLLFVGVFAVLLFQACEPATQVAMPYISPIHGINKGQILVAGTTLPLYVDIQGLSNLNIRWRDPVGTIPNSNNVSIQYIVPDLPGQAFITAEVLDKQGNVISTTTTEYEIIPSTGGITGGVISSETPLPSASEASLLPTNTITPMPFCLSGSSWFAYNADSTVIKGNCWDFSAWGVTTSGNQIFIHPSVPATHGISHGIYIPVKNTSRISFQVTINKFDLMLGLSGYVSVGIINAMPPGPATSLMIYYLVTSPGNYVAPWLGKNGSPNILDLAPLEFSTSQSVILAIDGNQLDINVNGEDISPINLPFDQRAFWIGYFAPQGSSLDAVISNLEIH